MCSSPAHGWALTAHKCSPCGELATSLLTVKPVGVYSTTLVRYLYISCYVTVNKLVLSYPERSKED
jgi:hypothetical protein